MRRLVIMLAVVGLSALAMQGGEDVRAEGPATAASGVEYHPVRTEAAGVWEVTLLRYQQFFYGCRAERLHGQGASVLFAVRREAPEKVAIYLRGPVFGGFVANVRALARIDNGPTMTMLAERAGSESDTVLVLNYSQTVSDAIKKGKELTIAINGYKFTIPLTDTGKMIDALSACVADGQSAVDDYMFDNAVEAPVKGAVR